MKNANRIQKDYLDAIEARLIAKYGNKRKLYQEPSRRILPRGYVITRPSKRGDAPTSSSYLPMSQVYEIKLAANR